MYYFKIELHNSYIKETEIANLKLQTHVFRLDTYGIESLGWSTRRGQAVYPTHHCNVGSHSWQYFCICTYRFQSVLSQSQPLHKPHELILIQCAYRQRYDQMAPPGTSCSHLYIWDVQYMYHRWRSTYNYSNLVRIRPTYAILPRPCKISARSIASRATFSMANASIVKPTQYIVRKRVKQMKELARETLSYRTNCAEEFAHHVQRFSLYIHIAPRGLQRIFDPSNMLNRWVSKPQWASKQKCSFTTSRWSLLLATVIGCLKAWGWESWGQRINFAVLLSQSNRRRTCWWNVCSISNTQVKLVSADAYRNTRARAVSRSITRCQSTPSFLLDSIILKTAGVIPGKVRTLASVWSFPFHVRRSDRPVWASQSTEENGFMGKSSSLLKVEGIHIIFGRCVSERFNCWHELCLVSIQLTSWLSYAKSLWAKKLSLLE